MAEADCLGTFKENSKYISNGLICRLLLKIWMDNSSKRQHKHNKLITPSCNNTISGSEDLEDKSQIPEHKNAYLTHSIQYWGRVTLSSVKLDLKIGPPCVLFFLGGHERSHNTISNISVVILSILTTNTKNRLFLVFLETYHEQICCYSFYYNNNYLLTVLH